MLRCIRSGLILTMRWTFIFLIIIFTKWEYQPKECSGPSAHSRENLLEIFVLLLLSLPQLIHSCVTCMCVSLHVCLTVSANMPKKVNTNTPIEDLFCSKNGRTEARLFCSKNDRYSVTAGLLKKWQKHTDTQTDGIHRYI